MTTLATATATALWSTLALATIVGCGSPQHVAAGGDLGSVELSDDRCAGGTGPTTAYEIIHTLRQQVYIAGGDRPITDAAWDALESLAFPWQKNSSRHLLSTGGCLFRSPDAAADCQGDACFSLTEVADATWLYLARAACTGCYPADGACDAKDPIPPPGHLRVVDLEKCHDLYFEGEIFELTDPWGEHYMMHASAAADRDGQLANIAALDLPTGWSVGPRTLSEPRIVKPRIIDGVCHHTIVRDDQDNAYHLDRVDTQNAALTAVGCPAP